jgi:hypothetical protein
MGKGTYSTNIALTHRIPHKRATIPQIAHPHRFFEIAAAIPSKPATTNSDGQRKNHVPSAGWKSCGTKSDSKVASMGSAILSQQIRLTNLALSVPVKNLVAVIKSKKQNRNIENPNVPATTSDLTMLSYSWYRNRPAM